MILQVDMGNTRLKWRIRHLSVTLDFGTQNNEDDFSCLEESLREYRLQGVWVVSVVSAQEEELFSRWVNAFLSLDALFIRSNLSFGKVQNGYRVPSRLGVDRWAGIVGGYSIVQNSFVLVDIGSAITVDAIAADGKHLGGYIAPGLAMMRRSLARETSRINLGESKFIASDQFGCDTDTAVGAAQSVMVASLVQHAYDQLLSSNLDMGEPKILITGGDASWLRNNFPSAIVLPDLVLDGLELIASSV